MASTRRKAAVRYAYSSSSSSETTDSQSSAPTSLSSDRSARQREYAPKQREYTPKQREYAPKQREYTPKPKPTCYSDVSPGTSLYPRSSVDTYTSTQSEDDLNDVEMEDYSDDEQCAIPPLKPYRREVEEPYARPSNPQDFAKLFPSLNRLSIRHDEYTSDGNLNLRVDTTVSIPGHRKMAMQLFHLRMYELAKREFSLRRYCRDSGREVCHSKRKYEDAGSESKQRSLSSALKTLGSRPQFRRAGSNSSALKRPTTSSSSWEADDETQDGSSMRSASFDKSQADSRYRHHQPPRPVPTNTIKLEFSNYARVDITRRGSSGGRGKKSSKRYEFDWWGHKYNWKRHVDKTLGTVSFHLIRDNDAGQPVAHIVPETRTPTQVLADEAAGGWVPPCHMWISDESVLEAMTDVADVIMATGLIALVDDCIRERWQVKKKTAARRFSMPGRSLTITSPNSRALTLGGLFHRRHSEQNPSPLRFASPVAA